MAPLIPFAGDLAALQEARRLMEPVDPQGAAAVLDRVTKQVLKLQDSLQTGLKTDAAKDRRAQRP